MKSINATPFNFPRVAESAAHTALIVIDMQADFCLPHGYMDLCGADIPFLSSCIPPIATVLNACRSAGMRIVHTREGYAADLSDLQPWKKAHVFDGEIKIGHQGSLGRALVRGEQGWNIVPELSPLPGELVIDKSSYGAFAFTRLEMQLLNWGIRNLILVGLTTDCCVTTTLREALDRGFDCLVLEDCVAAGSRYTHDAAITLMKRPSGTFGQVALSQDLISAL